MVQWSLVTAGIGVFAATCGAILGWGVFPWMVHKKVAESVIIKQGTPQYERFLALPQPLLFKVYIFNITNPQKVQEGELPIVKEVGPYVYKQFRKKTVKEFSDDGTSVTYTQQQFYEFDGKASQPLVESDRIVALNMQMNAFLQVFERELTDIFRNFLTKFNRTLDRTPIVRILKRLLDRIRGKRKIAENDPGLNLLMAQINANLNGVFNSPTSMFVSTTVREYLFEGVRFCINPTGLARAICKQIRDKGTKTIRALDDGSLAFSFFNHKNRTTDGVYEVHTGLRDPEKVLEIEKYDELDSLHVWLNSSTGYPSVCNMINGTDASAYPPFRRPGDSMYIFSADICRSVELYYQRETKYKGIPGFRYVTRGFLNEIGPEYANECFCVDRLVNVTKKKNGCLYSGALDLSECIDAPVILTLPHMLGAAQEYRKLVKGLEPNLKKHETFIEVQHLTGTPLQGGKRVQFNMFLKPINQITLTENLTTSLVPTIWVEEGIALNQEMVNVLKKSLINTLAVLDIVHYTLFIAGIIVAVVSVVIFISQRQKRVAVK